MSNSRHHLEAGWTKYYGNKPYTDCELREFIAIWQTSSTVSEAVHRLQESRSFRDTYSTMGWTSSTYDGEEPLSIRWAQRRATALRKKGINLKSIRARSERRRADGPNYSQLSCYAASFEETS
jgi:hypothetical protein